MAETITNIVAPPWLQGGAIIYMLPAIYCLYCMVGYVSDEGQPSGKTFHPNRLTVLIGGQPSVFLLAIGTFSCYVKWSEGHSFKDSSELLGLMSNMCLLIFGLFGVCKGYLPFPHRAAKRRGTFAQYCRLHCRWLVPLGLDAYQALDPFCKTVSKKFPIMDTMHERGTIGLVVFVVLDILRPSIPMKYMAVLGMLCSFPSARNIEFYWTQLYHAYSVMNYAEEHTNVVGVVLSVLGLVYFGAVLVLWSERQSSQQANIRLPPLGQTGLQNQPTVVDDSDSEVRLKEGWRWEMSCGCSTRMKSNTEIRICGMIGCDKMLEPKLTACGAYDWNNEH